MIQLTQNRPTYSSRAQRAVDQADFRSRQAIERFRDAQIAEFKKFWGQSREDIEAQLAVRGNKAVTAFNLHAASVAFVLNAGVDYPQEDYTPPLAYTKHTEESDPLFGHVTLN